MKAISIRFLLLAIFLLLPLSAEAANRFLTCPTTCTITAIDTTIWGTTSGGVGASVPGSGDAVILDAATCVGGVTCTATMGAGYNPTWQSLTGGTCTASTTGCILDFSVNNNSPTLGTFDYSGTGTRTLSMGNGTWTITGTTAQVWGTVTVTNFTLNANSSTVVFSATATGSRQLSFGAKTYNNITVNNAAASTFLIDMGSSAAATFNNLTFTNVRAIRLPQGVTFIISGTLTYDGTSTQQGTMYSTSAVTTLSVANANTLNWVLLQNITKAGAGSITAVNSFDGGGNTGITITGPAGGRGIIGGYMLPRDLGPDNDNHPMWDGQITKVRSIR